MFAASLATTLSACATSPARPTLTRDLPALPSYVAPVEPSPMHERQQAEDALAACLVDLDGANDRLSSVPDWYEQVRRGFATGEAAK